MLLVVVCFVYGVKLIDVFDKELLVEWDILSFLFRWVCDVFWFFVYWKSYLMLFGLV